MEFSFDRNTVVLDQCPLGDLSLQKKLRISSCSQQPNFHLRIRIVVMHRGHMILGEYTFQTSTSKNECNNVKNLQVSDK